jgi:hypothetical protein
MDVRRDERRGTAVVRVWVDKQSPAPLLVRILEVTSAFPNGRTVAVAASVEDACDALREWLWDITDP